MRRFGSYYVVIVILALPLFADAQEGYFRLIGLPYEPVGNASIAVFVEALYRVAIGVAAMVAVVRLILAGAKYVLTDVVTSKESAKNDIRTSIIGLVIVLGAVLVLNTINPQLTNLNVLNLNPVSVQLTQSTAFDDLNVGDVFDRTEVDVVALEAACDEIGGEFVLYGDSASCVTETTVSSEEYAELLAATDLTEAEKQQLLQLFESLPNSAELTTADFGEVLNNRDANALDNDHQEIFNVINERYSQEEFSEIVAQYEAEGESNEDAIVSAYEQVIREEAAFIQVPGGTQEIIDTRVTVCQSVNKEIYRMETSSGSHIVCL